MTEGGAAFELGEARPRRDVHRFSHEAMATVFEVHCVHEDARYARQAADAAFALVDRLEQELSRFVANSDVSRINSLAAGGATRVSPTTLECLAIARHLYHVTHGAFDVSIGTGLDALELDPETYSVHSRREELRLDLGAIGKGYAVDRVAELLGEWEVRNALVHGGFSSVLALEAPPGQEGWPLSLSAPDDGRILARLEARRLALGASGSRKGEHIRDPRTGRPAGERAVWVSVPREDTAGGSPTAVADALSTACMLLSEQEIRNLCRDGPGLEAWLLLEPPAGQATQAFLHLVGGRTGPGLEPSERRSPHRPKNGE
jgi:thiamine biosynthesis lipoprotein